MDFTPRPWLPFGVPHDPIGANLTVPNEDNHAAVPGTVGGGEHLAGQAPADILRHVAATAHGHTLQG